MTFAEYCVPKIVELYIAERTHETLYGVLIEEDIEGIVQHILPKVTLLSEQFFREFGIPILDTTGEFNGVAWLLRWRLCGINLFAGERGR